MKITAEERKQLHDLLDKALDQEKMMVVIVDEKYTSYLGGGFHKSLIAFYLMEAYKSITTEKP